MMTSTRTVGGSFFVALNLVVSILVVVQVALKVCADDEKAHWNYADQKGWAGEFALCKGTLDKFRQSPVDIITDKVHFDPRLQLKFVDYDQQVEFEFKNTHHSVSLTPINFVAPPSVHINWLAGEADHLEYELKEVHFHWGDGVHKGSEHEINDQKAAAEMHMVHYRKGLDKTDIGTTENSVLVVGVMIESDDVEHHKLESLVEKSEYVNGTDAEYFDENPEDLINLLPDSHHSFYTYNGSLTTPPCYEVVTWVIMSEPVYMNQAKLVELSNLEALDPVIGRQKIASNYRDIQPLLDRPVFASFNTTDSISPKLKQSSRFFDDGRFGSAFREYWRKVNQLKVTVNRAFKAIDTAKSVLRQRLGIRDNNKATPQAH